MRGVAGEQHAALAEGRRDALMRDIEIAMHDLVGLRRRKELLHPRLHGRVAHQLAPRAASDSVGNTVRHSPGGPSADTLKQLHHASGSAK